ncbi:hypothetical protein B0H17DRAFT_1097534 [Mycena rosella]|uniref:F-box domain-containing protein n=1 Tax=Mycena rosella TaxID=1033263 RepID=A0AAD7CQB4_MYCRO|nr:hypothetical protein B0H17DRAFT_1097534 [Mycena rosella]
MDAESSTARRPTKKRKSDTAPSAASAPKRARTSKKGRLAGLLDISLDVVFEIFGNLQPLDLLRLSRTSKEFRRLLMHRSSVTIWRSSLNNVPNLPPCAPGMTEPQWASLVFDATCHICQKIARKVDWGLFIRICNKCAKQHLDTQFRPLESVDMASLLNIIPTRSDPMKPYNRVYLRQALTDIRVKYNAIQDSEEQKKFVEDRKELVKSLEEHTALCETWSESVAENRSTELADLKEERYTAIIAKLTALGWGTELDSMLPSDSLKSHKLVKQPNVLTERTWKTIKPEMLNYMQQMKAKRLAREHAALVVERRAIATKVLRTFKRSQLPWTDIMPGAADFCDFPEIKTVLKQPAEVEVDEHSFESMLPAFPGMIATWREEAVKQLVLTRKRGCKEDAQEDDDEIKTRLKLATSVFKCNSCGDDDGDSYFGDIQSFDDGFGLGVRCRPLYWPRVLAHRCLTRAPDYAMLLMFMDGARDVPWRASILSVDTRVAGIVKKIVEACGMDAATTTVDDLDAADPRLACHVCAQRKPAASGSRASPAASGSRASPAASGSRASPAASAEPAPAADTEADTDAEAEAEAEAAQEEGPATVKAFSWRNAVRHEGEAHWRRPTAWQMLGDEDAAAARAAEAEVMAEKRKGKAKISLQDVVDNAASEAASEASGNMDEAEDGSSGVEAEKGGDAPMPLPDAEVDAPSPSGILPSELPEVVWSCAHCLDGPAEKPPMALEGMLRHLAVRHDILAPALLNEDYYRTLAAPEVYSKAHFPAPALTVSMPPCPPLPSPPPRARSYMDPFMMHPYDDSDDSGEGYDSFDDMMMGLW